MLSLPLITDDDGDLDFFASVLDVENYIEPVDASSFIAFDAAGQLLALKVQNNRVVVAPLEPSQHDPDQLEWLLNRFIAATGRTAPSLALSELVPWCVRQFGYTR